MSEIERFAVKLGRKTNAEDVSLDPVPRNLSRESLNLPAEMKGRDLWNAYEASYLLPSGRPVSMILRITYDSESKVMVESKSLKLYLNHLAEQVFKNQEAYLAKVQTDLAACLGQTPVLIPFEVERFTPTRKLAGVFLDQFEPISITTQPDMKVLQLKATPGVWRFQSYALRTLCPVTGQPDWAAVTLDFQGRNGLEPASLLTYLVGFRNSREFHEATCERIFSEIYQVVEPDWLHVTCCYTRRGGIDINPTRVIGTGLPTFHPVWRQ